MEADVKTDTLMMLLARIPNWVSERTVRSRISYATAADVERVLEALHAAGDVERKADPGGAIYYRLMRREGLPIRKTITIGDTEIPRLLANSSPEFLPEHFNDAVEQLAELSTTLERRFKKGCRGRAAPILGEYRRDLQRPRRNLGAYPDRPTEDRVRPDDHILVDGSDQPFTAAAIGRCTGSPRSGPAMDRAMSSAASRGTSNITFDRTAGSHSLAAAGQRERWAGVRLQAEGTRSA
jgi:hypothetical protein